MTAKNNLCVSVPIELQCYQKTKDLSPEPEKDEQFLSDFGVKVIRTQIGTMDHVAYYSDTGDLIKRIYYDGTSISKIKYYRNASVYQEEIFSNSKLVKKRVFNRSGSIISSYGYIYNRNDNISCISKTINDNIYSIEYGYDELKRVNSRKIKANDETLNEQFYRYDILDRVVDYRDFNQNLHINQMNKQNELINYVITDKIGNRIIINNYFDDSGYKNTEITLNGHTMILKDKSYTDNVMLKKPYTTENDLDFIISNLFRETECMSTKRDVNYDISNNVINSSIYSRALPISIRKRVLLEASY